MFRVLPRNKELDELWRAGLVYSRALAPDQEWMPDELRNKPPSEDHSTWEYAIQVEE